ncbi:WD40 repeat-like protein [Imleria badia]|nr:WD40 repeat-like protein [Imleria badia]
MGDKIRELNGRNVILSVAFLPDGKHLISGGWEGILRRWQVQDGREVGTPINTGPTICGTGTSKDGNWAVTTNLGVMVVSNAKTDAQVIARNGHANRWVRAVDVSPDSTRFATASDDQTACIWSITTGQLLVGPIMHETAVIAVKYSPQGDRIATATMRSINSVRIFDSRSGQLLHILPSAMPIGHEYCTPLTWSNHGQLFVGSAARIVCFNGLTGSLLSEWIIQTGGTHTSVAISSNGKFIACATDRSISFWDTSTRQRIGPIIQDPAAVYCIALSPDNMFLASGGGQNRIMLRSLRDVLPPGNLTSDVTPDVQGLATPPGIPDGNYRIRGNTGNLYLTRPQGGAGPVVVQPLNQSNGSQIWTFSRVVNGAYNIVGNTDAWLTAGIRNTLITGRRGTTWNFDPRGDAYLQDRNFCECHDYTTRTE